MCYALDRVNNMSIARVVYSLLGFAPSRASWMCRQWPTLASMQGKILFVVINTYAPQYLAQASDPRIATLVKLAANWRLDAS